MVERKEHTEILRSAYKFHKQTLGLGDYDRLKPEGPEWDAMKAATAVEYADAEKAKRAEYNARRNFRSAIQRFRAKALA